MSRVYRRGKTWWIDFSMEAHRIRQSAHTTKKAEAEAIMAKLQEELRQKKFFGKKAEITLSTLLNRYYEEISPTKKRPKDDFYTIRVLLRFFGDIPISTITRQLLNQYKKARLDDGLSAAAVNRPLNLLSHAFNTAITEWEIADTNPVATVKKEREENRLRFLTRPEADKLIYECKGHLKPIVEWALATGMRQSEILRLERNDLERAPNFIFCTNTKNGKDRLIPFTEIHGTILAQSVAHFSGVVFHYKGSRVKSVHKTFSGAAKRAGLNDINFHTLRHTFASWAVMSGMPLNELMEILGHSSLDMVMKYAHLSPEHLRSNMEKVSG